MIKIRDKEFDEDKIFFNKPAFDSKSRQEYLDYLFSIPEKDVIKMDITHAYERIRYIAQKEQAAILKTQGYIPLNERIKNEPQRSHSGRPQPVYKNWTQD